MSRRLGRSLGVDLVPFKTCTYDCIYCQLGRTTDHTGRPQPFYDVDVIMSQVHTAIESAGHIDYVSLAGSGEPTLNSQIGEVIDRIKTETKTPLTVLTNGSLLWDSNVRKAVAPADIVLPSLDAGTEDKFNLICRPCKGISFEQVVDGLITFAGEFGGDIRLEVMLLDGINTSLSEIRHLSGVVGQIQPNAIQLNTVVRPPSERQARAVPRSRLIELADLFDGPVEIVSSSSVEPGPTEHTVSDEEILSYLRRRPTGIEDIASGLNVHRNEIGKRLQALVDQGVITTVRCNDKVLFQMRSKDA